MWEVQSVVHNVCCKDARNAVRAETYEEGR